MKKIYILSFIVLALISSCDCDKSDDNTSTDETPVVFKYSYDSNISLSGSLIVNVELTSSMPSTEGIIITALVKDKTNNQEISQNAALSTSEVKNAITLINLPRQHWCTVDLSVTSHKTPSNKATQSFEVIYK